MVASQPSISFTVQTGATNIPATQTITITSSTSAVLNYTATATTQAGGNWLAIQGASSGKHAGEHHRGIGEFRQPDAGSIYRLHYHHFASIEQSGCGAGDFDCAGVPTLTVNPNSFTVSQIRSSGRTVCAQTIVVTAVPVTSPPLLPPRMAGPLALGGLRAGRQRTPGVCDRDHQWRRAGCGNIYRHHRDHARGWRHAARM